MALVTPQQLENASADSNTISDVINGGENTIVTSRLGRVFPTLAKIFADWARSATAAITSLAAFNYRGDWVAATTYAIKDVVTVDEVSYVTSIDHMSGTTFAEDLATGKWTVHQGLTIAQGEAMAGGFDPIYDGAVGDAETDDTIPLLMANARGKMLYINRAHVISGTTSLGRLVFGPQGKLIVASGSTLTITSVEDVEDQQLFDVANDASVRFIQTWARMEWFGNTDANGRQAVDALPIMGGVIRCGNRRYDSPYASDFIDNPGVTFLARPYVRFVGTRTPEYSADNTQLQDGSGTIFNGSFHAWAEGVEIEKIGFDCGSVQRNRLGLYKTQDCLAIAPPTHTQGVFRHSVRVADIIALGVDTDDFGHGVLLEGYTSGTVMNCEARFGIHGFVVKSSGIQGNNIRAFGHRANGMIFKSDDYGVLVGLNLTNLTVGAIGVQGPTNGINCEAALAGGGSINLSNINITGPIAIGVLLHGLGFPLHNVNITNITIDVNVERGIYVDGTVNPVRYVNITNAIINNSTYPFTEVGTVDHLSVRGISIVNASECFNLENDTVIMDTIIENTDVVFKYNNDTARPKIGSVVNLGSNAAYTNLPTPELHGTWANYGSGNPDFRVYPLNGMINLEGFVTGGPDTLLATLPSNWRPPQSLYFPIRCSNGGGLVVVQNDGDVVVIPDVTGPTWVSLTRLSWTA